MTCNTCWLVNEYFVSNTYILFTISSPVTVANDSEVAVKSKASLEMRIQRLDGIHSFIVFHKFHLDIVLGMDFRTKDDDGIKLSSQCLKSDIIHVRNNQRHSRLVSHVCLMLRSYDNSQGGLLRNKVAKLHSSIPTCSYSRTCMPGPIDTIKWVIGTYEIKPIKQSEGQATTSTFRIKYFMTV